MALPNWSTRVTAQPQAVSLPSCIVKPDNAVHVGVAPRTLPLADTAVNQQYRCSDAGEAISSPASSIGNGRSRRIIRSDGHARAGRTTGGATFRQDWLPPSVLESPSHRT